MPKRTKPIQNAQAAVYNAVKKGLLPSAKGCSCTDCGKSATEYDHYLGYEVCDRLNVQPVCSSCHAKRGFSRRVEKRNACRYKLEGPRLENGRFYSGYQRKTPKLIGPRMKNGHFYSQVQQVGIGHI